MSTEAGLDIEGVLAEVTADSLHNLGAGTYWADDGEGGEHFIDYPIRALSAHVAAAVRAHLAEWLGSGEVVAAVARAYLRREQALGGNSYDPWRELLPADQENRRGAMTAALNAVAEALWASE